jgi:hypothetical protein
LLILLHSFTLSSNNIHAIVSNVFTLFKCTLRINFQIEYQFIPVY